MTAFEIKKKESQFDDIQLGDYIHLYDENGSIDDLFVLSLVDAENEMAMFVNTNGLQYLGTHRNAAEDHFKKDDTKAVQLFLTEVAKEVSVEVYRKKDFNISISVEEK